MLVTRVLLYLRRQQPKNLIIKIGQLRSSSTFEQEAQKFMSKHAKRGSPQSPYMLGLSYKIQLTSMLSLAHRITGIGLGLIIYGFGIAEMFHPNKNFSQLLNSYLSMLPSYGPESLKIMCGTILAYHTFNGVRHLCWDMGYGFSLQRLYLTGYLVLGLTALCVAMMANSQVKS